MKSFKKLIISAILPYLTSTNKIYSCKQDKTIALTFDDGPYKYTSELIDFLNTNDIKATFFINAENYWKDLPTNKDKQTVIRKAYDSGHQIASHTWAHNIPSDITEFNEMMKKMDSWVESIIGHKPAYFRAPRGECYSECMNYLEEKNYKLIQWDTDTNDWDISSGADYRVNKAKEFLTESFNYERSNYLVLMHDVYEHTVRKIVPWIASHKLLGYKFVTVAECLEDKSSMYRSSNVEQASETKVVTSTTTTVSPTPTPEPTSITTNKSKTTTTTTTTVVVTKTITEPVIEPTNLSSSTGDNDSQIITDDNNDNNLNYNNYDDNNTINNTNNNDNDTTGLTNNDNLEGFYNNTLIDDDIQGNLNYESSSTSIIINNNYLLLFSLFFIILKLIYL